MNDKKIKFRKYESVDTDCKPLITGWIPTRNKLELIKQGKESELPGYRLYQIQTKLSKAIGKFCGFLFGLFYANKKGEPKGRKCQKST